MPIGGTTVSVPIWAGLIALINQALGARFCRLRAPSFQTIPDVMLPSSDFRARREWGSCRTPRRGRAARSRAGRGRGPRTTRGEAARGVQVSFRVWSFYRLGRPPPPHRILKEATVACSKARPYSILGRGTGRFFPLKKNAGPGRARAVHRRSEGGAFNGEWRPPIQCFLSLSQIIDQIFLVGCGCRWVCGQRRAFPRVAQQNGGSTAGRLQADCPYIHGYKPGLVAMPVGSVPLSGPAVMGMRWRASVFQERLSTGTGRVK
jgi:hypothetical protein